MRFVILATLVLVSLPISAAETLLLTKSLDFLVSPHSNKTTRLQVGKQPTLIRLLGESGGLSEVEIFQQNGKAVNKRMFVSSKWLKRGTDSRTTDFQIDPNLMVNRDYNELLCEDPEVEEDIGTAKTEGNCEVLSSGSSDVAKHMKCFNHLKEKLNIRSPNSAYGAISKLYTLEPEEQKFMALILTMFGEARGTSPVQAHMAAVMKVVENRTEKANMSDPDLNELDIVLQDSQFSMFNPRDPNWRAAFKASANDMKNAIMVYAQKKSRSCDVIPAKIDEDKVYHYATFAPFWAHQGKEVNMSVDGKKLSAKGAHRFWAGVPWSFNSSNRYKRYARQKGLL